MAECSIALQQNVLFTGKDSSATMFLSSHFLQDYEFVNRNFCGVVVCEIDELTALVERDAESCKCQSLFVYEFVNNLLTESIRAHFSNITVLTELFFHSSMGSVPINVHGVGVMYRQLFSGNGSNFKEIEQQHQFQALTESNKPSMALRKGIYLTKVENAAEESCFKLLRCSSNFKGPTENFAAVDDRIIEKTNRTIATSFEGAHPVNHVLAQIYYNVARDESNAQKESKARISKHSDKTKDMPTSGVIAFASFYDTFRLSKHEGRSKTDAFDVVLNGSATSVLTTLEFELKNPANHPSLCPRFSVKLYPNSLFVIPLSTNRLYTHAIRPSSLPVDVLPTRMGYVMRCSKTNAIHDGKSTFIVDSATGERRRLEEMTESDARDIKALYWRENVEESPISYPMFYTSFNGGDYLAPIIGTTTNE